MECNKVSEWNDFYTFWPTIRPLQGGNLARVVLRRPIMYVKHASMHLATARVSAVTRELQHGAAWGGKVRMWHSSSLCRRAVEQRMRPVAEGAYIAMHREAGRRPGECPWRMSCDFNPIIRYGSSLLCWRHTEAFLFLLSRRYSIVYLLLNPCSFMATLLILILLILDGSQSRPSLLFLQCTHSTLECNLKAAKNQNIYLVPTGAETACVEPLQHLIQVSLT